MKQQHTSIDLLRHGELETPALFCAHADEPLSKKGQQDLANATRQGEWDIIISSPYQRCQSFAKTLTYQKNCTLIIEPAFQEMDFGDWIGIPTKTLWEQQSTQLKQLWNTPENFVAPAGESMQAFTQRVTQSWQTLISKHADKRILLITHAGVIRAILTHALKFSHASALTFNIEYAHFTQLYHYPDDVYSLRAHGNKTIIRETKH